MTTMVVNKTIQHIMDLGISENEARAYLALLSVHPATAYETAREAGIPTSKIYQVMDRLEARGMAQAVMAEGKKTYAPMRPDDFIAGQKQRIESTLDTLKSDLARTACSREVSYIWNIRDQAHILERARRMIDESADTLLLSLWGDEAAALEPCLRKAASRGLRIATVLFGGLKFDIGTVFRHPIEDTIYNEKGGRGITVVSDSREALMGTVAVDGAAQGAWSMNEGFVTLAEDYVSHDIYIMKIVSRFDRELIGRFGRNYRLLRDIFSDREAGHEGG